MIAVAALPLWQGRAPRFLFLLLGAWILLRLAMAGLGDQAAPAGPAAPAGWPGEWASAAPRAVPISANRPAHRLEIIADQRAEAVKLWPVPMAMAASVPLAPAAAGVWASSDRHRLRLEWLTSLLPAIRPKAAGAGAAGALGGPLPPYFPPGPAEASKPVRAASDAAMGRWSLAAWAQWRSGHGTAPLAARFAPSLGGSQAGARVDYRLDDAGRWRLFGRVTAAPGARGMAGQGQSDAALGAAVRPIAALPVDLLIEQRFAIAGPGRNRTLVYAAGGVDRRPLAHGFRLSAYAQGGVAGPGDAEAFVDGAMGVDRPVAAQRGVELALGAMAAGAAQRGASRIDVGPRATLTLPHLGEGARVALDWRERVAGNARPGSGIAVTLSAGF